MKITLNTRLSMLADFLYVMESGIQGKTCYENGLRGLEPSDGVCNAIEDILNDYDWNIPGLRMLFMPSGGKRGYVEDNYSSKIHLTGTVGNLINLILGDPHRLIALLVEYHSGIVVRPETMTAKSLREKISRMDIPDDIKREIMDFTKKPMGIASGLRKFMNRIRRRIKKAYADNVDDIRNASKTTGIHLRHEGASYLQIIMRALPADAVELRDRVAVSVVYLNEFAVEKIEQDNLTLFLLGYRFNEALKAMDVDDTRETMERFLKAFSEENRINIIRMITKGEMYVGEVAEEIDLAISTTSYHLDMLMAAGILNHRVVDKRAYYSMNPEFTADMFLEISEVFRKGIF